MLLNPTFTFAGLIVGMAVGLTGIGGSALMAPLLAVGFGVAPSLTVGTDLLYSVPTKILACVLHARRGNIDWTVTKWLCIGGLPGALIGLAVFFVVRSHADHAAFEATIAHMIGAAVLIACVGIVITSLPRFASRPAAVPVEEIRQPWAIISIGAIVGFLVSLTSIGAGSVTLPLLSFALRKISLRRLIGSEIAFAAFLVPIAALGHITFKNVDWGIALALVAGSLPGVWLGTRLASSIGDRWMRPIVAGLLALSGWKLI